MCIRDRTHALSHIRQRSADPIIRLPLPFKEKLIMLKRKDATKFTEAANKALCNELSWDDTQDFKLARRGFIASLDDPVIAVIYTHSHVDHWGGVKGVIAEADVTAGKIKVIAPEHFLEYVISENIIAGNVMNRCASYMYGNLLPKDVKGQVGAGLGQTTSTGLITLIV